MEFWLLCGISTIVVLTASSGSVHLPQVVVQHGPLYEGLQYLIADERLNSEIIWNITQKEIHNNSKILFRTLANLHKYEQIIGDKLMQLHGMANYDALKQCYTQYERQIARFNRDLMVKYRACRHALNSSLSQLEDEIENEMFYLRDAAIEVQEVAYDCNIRDLRKPDGGHLKMMQITMCVLSRLGDIKQQSLAATQICLDVLSRIVVSDMAPNDDGNTNDGDGDGDENEFRRPAADNVCWEFANLRDEFETIYERMQMCAKDV